MLYVLFGRNDNDCLLAVSVSVGGGQPSSTSIYPLVAGRGTEFRYNSLRVEQRFSKGTLQAASWVEIYSMTQGEKERYEHWDNFVMEIA